LSSTKARTELSARTAESRKFFEAPEHRSQPIFQRRAFDPRPARGATPLISLDPSVLQLFDEGLRVVVLVRAQCTPRADPWLARPPPRVPPCPWQASLARRRKAVAVLHKRVTEIGQTALLTVRSGPRARSDASNRYVGYTGWRFLPTPRERRLANGISEVPFEVLDKHIPCSRRAEAGAFCHVEPFHCRSIPSSPSATIRYARERGATRGP
jgi:hypothetical protein